MMQHKYIKNLTLYEVKKQCEKVGQDCKICFLSNFGKRCILWNDEKVSPNEWPLDERLFCYETVFTAMATSVLFPSAQKIKVFKEYVHVFDKEYEYVVLTILRRSQFPCLNEGEEYSIEEIISGKKLDKER